MRLQVKGKNVEVSPSLRQYAEAKLAKLEKQLAGATQVELELSEEKNPSIQASHVAEATIFTKGSTLRAREAAADMPSVDRPARREPRAAGQALPREADATSRAGTASTTTAEMSLFRRGEPLHVRLAREGGLPLGDERRPRGPWDIAGIHGLHRPRQWDAVVTAEAPGLEGERAAVRRAPDGTLVVEEGPDDVEPLAAAVEGRAGAALPGRGGAARARSLGGRGQGDRGRRAARSRRRARSSSSSHGSERTLVDRRRALVRHDRRRSSGPSTSCARAASTARPGSSWSTRSERRRPARRAVGIP